MSEGLTKQDLSNLREATKQDLQQGLRVLRESTKQVLHTLREGLEAVMTANTQDIISHFNQSRGYQNERLEVIDVKLDALMRESVVRKELRNLVGELHDKGVSVDSNKIFLSTP